MSDATADPIGVPQDVLNAFLDCPGSLEASLLAAVRSQNAALVAENKKLRTAIEIAREFLSDRCDIDNNGGPNAEMSALNEMRMELGEIP